MSLWSIDPCLPSVLSEADRFPVAKNVAGIESVLENPTKRSRLIETCHREGLSGLLYRYLIRPPGSIDPAEEIFRRVRARYLFALQINLMLMDRCAGICRALNAARISVILLQGASLIGPVYSDPGVRPMTDLDLWIGEQDVSRAASVLGAIGYGVDPHYPMTFVNGVVHVDLHTDLFWGERISARKGLLGTAQKRIFADSEGCLVGGERARRLSPCDQILYLSMHVLKHNADRMIWLVDIRRLLSGFSKPAWQALFARAQGFGVARQLAGVLFLIRTVFAGTHWPKEADAFITSQGLSAIERFCFRRRRTRSSLPILFALLFMAGLENRRRAAGILLESLYPRPEILRQVFPQSSRASLPRLYAKRTGQLAWSLWPRDRHP